MRTLTLISIVIFLLTSCSNNQTTSKPSNDNLDVELSKIEVSIDGMTCTGCEQTIQASVSELPGINSVKASHVDSNAVIEYNVELVSISEIKDAINETGYKVVDIAIQ